ncbi:hypothetical protein N9F37_00320 [bacterium]|nr:hypothetical protein [bacterium]MDB4421780.1 hypothetical protein [Akkermansiaceae bacterium]MDB4508923.1 hypothetical protein [Akkermansiaceae bacterium]MDB4546463.1 hypothetical protein [Akkermansiaceae bacterium]
MDPVPQNPFAAAAQPATKGTPVQNPFQAASEPAPAPPAPEAAAADASPFAGMGTESPFGLVDSSAGRPAKLPERRFPETAANGANGADGLLNERSPFERAGAPAPPQSASPFEAVIGGPTEGFLAEGFLAEGFLAQGFLAERPGASSQPPVQYQPPAPEVAPPVAQPDPATNGSSPFGVAPAARQEPAAFEPAPSSPQNGNNGLSHAGFAPVSAPPAARHEPASFEPAVAERPAPAAFKEVASAPAVVAPAGQQKGGYAHGGMPQLVLRAIFGVSHELSADEMLQRARTLPGVRNLRIVGAEEAAAMKVLRVSVSRLGFGEEHSIGLSSADGDVDIIEEEGTTVAVLHEDGGYAAGVRETLIIVTRELARLTS